MYEHVIDDEQAPATCDAHKTLFSPSDEVKAACDFWWKWPCIVEQDLKTHPQIKWHENEIFFSSTELQWQHFQLFQSSINTNGSFFWQQNISVSVGEKNEWIKQLHADSDKSHLSYSCDNGQECIYEETFQITHLALKKDTRS